MDLVIPILRIEECAEFPRDPASPFALPQSAKQMARFVRTDYAKPSGERGFAHSPSGLARFSSKCLERPRGVPQSLASAIEEEFAGRAGGGFGRRSRRTPVLEDTLRKTTLPARPPERASGSWKILRQTQYINPGITSFDGPKPLALEKRGFASSSFLFPLFPHSSLLIDALRGREEFMQS